MERRGPSPPRPRGGRPWYHHPRFNSYWRHYNQLVPWFHHHKQITENQQVRSQEQWMRQSQYLMQMWWWHYLQNPWSCAYGGYPASVTPHRAFKVPGPPPPARVKTNNMKVSPRLVSKKARGRKRSTSRTSSKERRKRQNRSRSSSRRWRSGVFAGHTEGEDEGLFCEMSIDEDLLKFLAQSAQHRKERDARKRPAPGEEEEEHGVDFDSRYAAPRTSAAPTERPGRRRTAEMKLLYGTGAAMIHGMETAMQLTFDRNCDIKQPKPWPNLPLSIKF